MIWSVVAQHRYRGGGGRPDSVAQAAVVILPLDAALQPARLINSAGQSKFPVLALYPLSVILGLNWRFEAESMPLIVQK